MRSDRGVLTDPLTINTAINGVPLDHVQTTKEFVRHGLMRTGLTRGLDVFRKLKGFQTSDYLSDSPAETFANTYAKGGWVHEDAQESLSGVGSSAAATEGLVDKLERAITALGCTSLVDVGCGDWNWMKRQQFGFSYTGVDIVGDVIAQNQRLFARDGVRFDVCNAIVSSPPKADMALCREVLFHLSFNDIRAVLNNIIPSANYLCATTDFDIAFNADIRTGDYRKLNLTKPPFALPTPLCLIDDTALSPGRFLGVWKTTDL